MASFALPGFLQGPIQQRMGSPKRLAEEEDDIDEERVAPPQRKLPRSGPAAAGSGEAESSQAAPRAFRPPPRRDQRPPRSSSRAHGRDSLDDGDQDLWQALSLATADLSLENAATNREQRGYLETTVLADAEAAMIISGLEGAKQFEKDKQDKQKQKGAKRITSAHVQVALKSLQSLAQIPGLEKDHPALFQALSTFWSEVVQVKSEEELASQIPIFKIFRPKVPSRAVTEKMGRVYARLVYRFKPPGLQCSRAAAVGEALEDYSRAMGWQVMHGTAPRGGKERTAVDILKQLTRR